MALGCVLAVANTVMIACRRAPNKYVRRAPLDFWCPIKLFSFKYVIVACHLVHVNALQSYLCIATRDKLQIPPLANGGL